MKTKGRMTKKKSQVLELFTCWDVSGAGGYPLTARDAVDLLNGATFFERTEAKELDMIRAMRRTLETLVRDGYLVHEVSEDYYEVSTQRTIKRKGIAYDLPKELRVGRPAEFEKKYNKYGSHDSGVFYFDAEKEVGKGNIIEGESTRVDELTGTLECFEI
ncbi:TPA: hypothetical protein ACGIMR_000513 [Salmonella enterica subsp. enterica serovar Javiana]